MNGDSPAAANDSGRACALLLAAWAAAWLAGLPLPTVDDGFFSGAAIHLAATGHLANPWIEGWMRWIPGVHLGRFLIQPPFQAWVMAGWIRLFGVSARSLTGFACAAGAAAALAAARLARRLGADGVGAFLAGALLSLLLLERGLRPEPLGIACWLLGQILMLRSGSAAWAGGCLLNALAPGFHAFLAVFSFPALAAQFLFRRRSGGGQGWAAEAAIALLAAALAALIFLGSIGGDLRAFAHDFLGHARLVTPASGHRLGRFLKQLLVGWEGVPNLVALAGAAVASALMAGRGAAARRALAWSWAMIAAITLLGLRAYAPFAVAFAVVGLAGATLTWSRHAGGLRPLLWVPALALIAWKGAQLGLQAWINARSAAPAAWSEARGYIAGNRPDLVVFDSDTLRYVFDFRPPPQAVDMAWAWSPGVSERRHNPAALGPRDVWAVDPAWATRTALARLAPAGPLILGRRLRSLRRTDGVALVAGEALPPAPPPLAFFRPQDLARH